MQKMLINWWIRGGYENGKKFGKGYLRKLYLVYNCTEFYK